MKAKRKRKDNWAEYERRKRRIANRVQRSTQYEQQIQKITRELKL